MRRFFVYLLIASTLLAPQTLSTSLAQEEDVLLSQKNKVKKKSSTKRAPPKKKSAGDLPKKKKERVRAEKPSSKQPRPAKAKSKPQEVAPAAPRDELDIAAPERGRVQPTRVMMEARRAYRAKDFRRAVDLAQGGIRSAKSSDEANRLRLIKGLSLYRLGLRASSLREFLEVARRSPSARDLKSSMMNAIVSARESRSEEALLPVYGRYSLNNVSQDVRQSLSFRIGKAYIRSGDPREAIQVLKRVGRSNPNYLDALLLQGIAWNRLKDRTQAYRYFKAVLEAGVTDQSDQAVWELANLNAARVAFAQGNYLRAVEHYQRVPRSSTFWTDSLFEASWPLFHVDDYNLALGYLKTMTSPFYVVKFFPESIILRAIILFRLCKYGDMRKAIDFYRREYSSYIPLLTAYLRDRKDSSTAYFNDVQAYLSAEQGDPGEVPGRVWDRLVTDVAFVDMEGRRKLLLDEKDKLVRIGFSGTGIETEATRFIDERLAYIQNAMNNYVRSEIGRSLSQLRMLEDQLNVLELEQTLGEKRAIEELRTPLQETDIEVSVSIPPDYEFWPYTGEYWKDELGFYAYSTGDSCQAE